MSGLIKSLVSFFVVAFTLFFGESTKAPAQEINTIYNTAYPSVIRVAIRAYNNPSGPILWVQTVGFQEYCSDVLANEWIPSWNPEALRAGAIAVKMFAWYHSLHPVTASGWIYDVDNTTNYQEFKYQSGTYQTDLAVRDTWRMAYTPANGEILPLNYRSGIPFNANWSFIGSNFMSQWGSEYWASTAKMSYLNILALFYRGDSIHMI